MYEWDGFDNGFDYVYGYGFSFSFSFDFAYNNECDYDYSFAFDCDYAYDNRKGPHKQSLIVKCFVTFKTRIFFIF